MGILAAVSIVAYLLYTLSAEIVAKHGTTQLYLTSLWILLFFLRYMQITFVEKRSGDPTQVFLRDYFLKGVVILWGVSIYLLLYFF